jgi:hypothetical protein
VQSCADQPFISRDEVLLKINQDLGSVNLEALPFTRYFTFVHLHNAGFCDAEINVYREALSKLVNSLSLGDPDQGPGRDRRRQAHLPHRHRRLRVGARRGRGRSS